MGAGVHGRCSCEHDTSQYNVGTVLVFFHSLKLKADKS